MSRLARRDTGPELAVRRLLHASGARYRVCYPVPGRPRRTIDIAFTRCKVAIFIDGCFWHGCPEHGQVPQANSAWWAEKLARNIERDRDTVEHLESCGWIVLRFWEHADPVEAVRETLETVRARRVSAATCVGDQICASPAGTRSTSEIKSS